MNTFEIIVQKIIKDQEQLIGPLAWHEASKIHGLRILDQGKGDIAIDPTIDSRQVIDSLVNRYGNVFGKAMTELLPSVHDVHFSTVPRLKFTLRISELIEEYLHFKTHNTKLSKADLLRQQIEERMKSDAGWQEYLRRRRS